MRHLAFAFALLAAPASAQVNGFEMEPPRPAFGGTAFGTTGAS